MIDASKTQVNRLWDSGPETPFQKLLDYTCVINGIDSWYKLRQVCSVAYPATQTWTLPGVLRWRDREALPDDYRLLCIADLADVSFEYALVCRGASQADTPAAVHAWRRLEAFVLADPDLATPDWDRFNATLEGRTQ